MSVNELDNRAREKWNKLAETKTLAPWIRNDRVFANIQKKVSGNPGRFWLNHVFQDLIGRRFRRVLSIGCGQGNAEILMARTGLFNQIDAYDISNRAIEAATQRAKEENIENVSFFVSSHQDMLHDKSRFAAYDCVCFFGSLHHVRDIEEMLRYVHNLLIDDGLLVFHEYTGPLYTLLDERQLDITNRLVSCFNPALRVDGESPYSNPSVKMVYEDDPTEGVRSSLILPLVALYFEKVHLIPEPGVIIQKLYQKLNHDRLNDGSPESNTIIDLLFEMEDLLIESGRLTPTNHIGVYRPDKSLSPLSVFGD